MQDDYTQWPPTTPLPYQQVEKTAPAPYSYEDTYWKPVPPPPPPPRTRKSPAWVLLPVIIGLLLTGVGTGYLFYRQDDMQKVVQLVNAVQAMPTVQPHLYTAEDIYNDFAAAGLGGTLDSTPDNWACCQYRPEGGYERWQRSDGSAWELAVFINTQEAKDDTNVFNKNVDGPGWAYVVQKCVLVTGPLSTNLIPKYKAIMTTNCV